MKFYQCKHCGNVVMKLTDSGVPVVCCGEPMELLEPGVVDAAVEKHVPVVTAENHLVTVKVGEVTHPMLEAHFIMWIALETEGGVQIHHLKPGDAPEAKFALAEGQKAVAAYAYCNLHGLWKQAL